MYCTNPSCREPLGADHVLLVTTAHVRRFCSVECVEPSRQAFERARAAAYAETRGEPVDAFIARLDHKVSHQRP